MARPVNPKNTTVSVKLSPGEREALENYRWDNRMEVSDVLRKAITSFFTAEVVKVTEPAAEAPAADAPDVEQVAEKPVEKPAEKPAARR